MTTGKPRVSPNVMDIVFPGVPQGSKSVTLELSSNRFKDPAQI